MNVLFLSVSQAISDISNRGIYPDLLRHFARAGHRLFILFPAERRSWRKNICQIEENISIVNVRIPNITKTSLLERGIATILIHPLFKIAATKYFRKVQFDLILYSTPPITFNSIIVFFKKKYRARTYLLLKDIFPQNAVDLGLLSKANPVYWYFRSRERKLYSISDIIGCMSPANVSYLRKQNPDLPESRLKFARIQLNFPKKQRLYPLSRSVRNTVFRWIRRFLFTAEISGNPRGFSF
jgi:hypothetical protein